MENLEQYLLYMQNAAELTKKLEDLVREDKEDGRLGLSGGSEALYKQQCDKASDKLKSIRKSIAILISESSAGLI